MGALVVTIFVSLLFEASWKVKIALERFSHLPLPSSPLSILNSPPPQKIITTVRRTMEEKWRNKRVPVSIPKRDGTGTVEVIRFPDSKVPKTPSKNHYSRNKKYKCGANHIDEGACVCDEYGEKAGGMYAMNQSLVKMSGFAPLVSKVWV